MHIFGQWRKLEYPERKPGIHGEKMQTPHRKAPAGIQTMDPLAVRRLSANHHTTVLAPDTSLFSYFIWSWRSAAELLLILKHACYVYVCDCSVTKDQ